MSVSSTPRTTDHRGFGGVFMNECMDPLDVRTNLQRADLHCCIVMLQRDRAHKFGVETLCNH